MDGTIGEIRMFASNFAPVGWMYCEGQMLDIMSNQPLYSKIGSAYGGNGLSTFALPDLRGRFPLHPTEKNQHGYLVLGMKTGSLEAQITKENLPPHSHAASGTILSNSEPATEMPPADAFPAAMVGHDSSAQKVVMAGYASTGNAKMAHGGVWVTTESTGEGKAFDIRNPYIGISYIICVKGEYDFVDPCVGEVRITAFPKVPYNWEPCDGQTMTFSWNPALGAVIGYTYGGYGEIYMLPNLKERSPVHPDSRGIFSPRYVGEGGGFSRAYLNPYDMPAHSHKASGTLECGASGNAVLPTGHYWALMFGRNSHGAVNVAAYRQSPQSEMAPDCIEVEVEEAGEGRPFDIQNPVMGLQFMICVEGDFPSFED